MPDLDVFLAWQAVPAPSPWGGPLLAYIGPGAGLDLLGYALALGLFTLSAVSAVLLWPVYALLRRIRGGTKGPAPVSPAENVLGAGRATSHAGR